MKLLLLIISFLFSSMIYSQSLMETVLIDGSNIVLKKPIKIGLKEFNFSSNDFEYYATLQNIDFNMNDSIQLKELIIKINSIEPDLSEWTENEITHKILVERNKSIKLKTVLKKNDWRTKEDKKELKKEIKEYNKKKKHNWMPFPVKVSKPVYSESGNYAIISRDNGSSTGRVSLYKKVKNKWIVVAHLRSIVY